MASAQIYSTSGDGLLRNSGTSSWATLRNAATGSLASSTGNSTQVYADNQADFVNRYIDRAIFQFDLTAVPSGATITAAVLSLYCSSFDATAGGAIGIVSGSPASSTSLATSDFGNVGSTEYITRVNISALSFPVYKDFTLNASGISYLQGKIGSTAALVLRTSFDIDNSAPTANSYSSAAFSTVEASGSSQDPYLTVTYTPAAAGAVQASPSRRTRGLYTR